LIEGWMDKSVVPSGWSPGGSRYSWLFNIHVLTHSGPRAVFVSQNWIENRSRYRLNAVADESVRGSTWTVVCTHKVPAVFVNLYILWKLVIGNYTTSCIWNSYGNLLNNTYGYTMVW